MLDDRPLQVTPGDVLPPLPSAGAVACLVVISDDPFWKREMGNAFCNEGFAASVDVDDEVAFDGAALREVDLCVVDLGLVTGSGVATCAAIRARSSMPIIATARRADEVVVLAAFAAGVDQFVDIDVSPREFVARVRALLRRFPPQRVTSAPAPSDGAVVLDETTCSVSIGGASVALSPEEFAVLGLLVARTGRVVRRTELQAVCGTGVRRGRPVESVIRCLRHKIESVDTCRRIRTVRSIGFRFVADADPFQPPSDV